MYSSKFSDLSILYFLPSQTAMVKIYWALNRLNVFAKKMNRLEKNAGFYMKSSLVVRITPQSL